MYWNHSSRHVRLKKQLERDGDRWRATAVQADR
jgi:hypothetical protein